MLILIEAVQSELPRQWGCAVPSSPRVPGCAPDPQGGPAGPPLLAELSCPAHTQSEITLRAGKAHPALTITLLGHTTVSNSIGNGSKELWSDAAPLATLSSSDAAPTFAPLLFTRSGP